MPGPAGATAAQVLWYSQQFSDRVKPHSTAENSDKPTKTHSDEVMGPSGEATATVFSNDTSP